MQLSAVIFNDNFVIPAVAIIIIIIIIIILLPHEYESYMRHWLKTIYFYTLLLVMGKWCASLSI